MKNSIRFFNFKIEEALIEFNYIESDNLGEKVDENRIYFKLSEKIIPSNHLVAVAISTLCARKFSEIYYDLELSLLTIEGIEQFTLSKVTCKKITTDINPVRKRQKNLTLNFSGGFDSLAALYLMPENTNLVSMDFGGRFSRERSYFQKYNTHIVETNLLETELRKNTWSFMGIASILYSDYLSTDYHTFGGILEASFNNFAEKPLAAKNISFPPFMMSNIENAPYVLGLTEIGTVMVLINHAKNEIPESLESLALPGEEKRYRKQVLCNIVAKKAGVKIDIRSIDPPTKPHFKFGQSFAADFLAFYTIKNAGLDIASHTVSNIPAEVVDLANELSLNFYERVNPIFLEKFPTELLGDLLKKLSDSGILPYTRNDWNEFEKVKELLAKYYSLN